MRIAWPCLYTALGLCLCASADEVIPDSRNPASLLSIGETIEIAQQNYIDGDYVYYSPKAWRGNPDARPSL